MTGNITIKDEGANYMHDLSFKRFKLRWFILYFIIATFFTVFISVAMPLGQYTNDITTLVLGLLLVLYMLYQRSSHNIEFSEASLQQEMPKKRWTRYIVFSFFVKMIGVITILTIGMVAIYFFQDSFEKVLEFINTQELGVMNGWNFVFLFISICIFAPIWEELFFRGILLRRFAMKWKATTSIIVSSFIFGLMHIGGSSMLHAFLFGCFLAYAYLRTKNIWVPIVLHSVSNFLSFVTLLFPGESNAGEIPMPSNDEIVSSLIICSVLLVLSVVLFIFIVKKNWSKVRNLPKVEELPIEYESQPDFDSEPNQASELTETTKILK